MTRTCQVLVEGDYDGVLVPGKHYIELKRDFSNVDEVLDLITKDELREEITQRAWEDVVVSGNFNYRNFVDSVINSSLKHTAPKPYSQWSKISHPAIYYWMQFTDRFAWLVMDLEAVFIKILQLPIVLQVLRYLQNLINHKETKNH